MPRARGGRRLPCEPRPVSAFSRPANESRTTTRRASTSRPPPVSRRKGWISTTARLSSPWNTTPARRAALVGQPAAPGRAQRHVAASCADGAVARDRHLRRSRRGGPKAGDSSRGRARAPSRGGRPGPPPRRRGRGATGVRVPPGRPGARSREPGRAASRAPRGPRRSHRSAARRVAPRALRETTRTETRTGRRGSRRKPGTHPLRAGRAPTPGSWTECGSLPSAPAVAARRRRRRALRHRRDGPVRRWSATRCRCPRGGSSSGCRCAGPRRARSRPRPAGEEPRPGMRTAVSRVQGPPSERPR